MNKPALLITIVLLSTTALAQRHASGPNPAAATEGLITPTSMAAPLRFLADDLLEGRGVASRGDLLSRLYLSSQFELFGLKPGGVNGTWEQPVPIVGIRPTINAPLQAKGPGGSVTFTAPRDYVLLPARPKKQAAWENAEVVFVGYGIEAKEQRWDDYKDVDVKGKVLLVMNNDPSTDPGLFAGKTRLYYGRWSYKYEEAARRGALGCIVIHTTPSAGYPFNVIQASHGQEEFYLPFGDKPTLEIRSWCSEGAARKMCQLGGKDLDTLRKQAESRDFRPVPLGVTVSTSMTNDVREIKSANVLGVLEGSDPVLKKEFIIITAHFDHLGRAIPQDGDDIYNGALDNASGCSALLNIARAAAALPQRPRRSLLFAAVTAEESGLLGSKYHAQNPTVPTKRLIANFNIDGINIWGRTRSIEMVGHGKNSLTALATAVAERRGRGIRADQETDKGLFYRSDHFSYAKVGVPSAYFKAGNDFLERASARRRVKAAYVTRYYHKANDEYDSRWRLDGAAEDTRLILECVIRCAQADAVPTWTKGDEFEKLR